MKVARNRCKIRIPTLWASLHRDRLRRTGHDLGRTADRRRVVVPRAAGSDRAFRRRRYPAGPRSKAGDRTAGGISSPRIDDFEGTVADDLIVKRPDPGAPNPTPVPSESPDR